MRIKLGNLVEYEGEIYSELDLDLESLTGAVSLSVLAQLRRRHRRDPVQVPETDDRYLHAMAARAAGIDEGMLGKLPAPTLAKMRIEVQNFLMGEAVQSMVEAEDQLPTAQETSSES